MAGNSLTENTCMLCGRGCPLTTQICTTSCRPTVAAPNHAMLKRVNATWYPTVFDERNKTNGQS